MEGKRKSEIVIVRDNEDGSGLIRAIRINVDLPWDRIENAMGFCSEYVLVDITGVLDEIERFKDALRSIKDTHDYIAGKRLLRTLDER